MQTLVCYAGQLHSRQLSFDSALEVAGENQPHVGLLHGPVHRPCKIFSANPNSSCTGRAFLWSEEQHEDFGDVPTAGFAKVTMQLEQGTTAWACTPLPQNRDLMMVSGGDGKLGLYK